MRRGLFGSALLALPFGAGVAHANGAIDQSPAGGLQFEHSVDIAIAQEDLFLSLPQVKVHYRYHSTAPAKQSVNISFPMPKLDLVDEPGSIDAVGAAQPPADPRNYMGFTARVNGHALQPQLREYAWLGETDVTATLKAAGIKPFLTQTDLDALAKRADSIEIKGLVANGIFDDNGAGDPSGERRLFPKWSYQAVYYWPQDFAPGDTEVDISYVPLKGGGGEFAAYAEDDPALSKAACIDEPMRKAVKSAKARPNTEVDAEKMGYIVDTARYWKGPIGRFNLTVEKPEPQKGGTELIAFCPLDAKKTGPRQWQWSADNYVPEADFEVVAWHFYSVQP